MVELSLYLALKYAIYIVNNYPVTKNKPIYHARISKQMNLLACYFICLLSEPDKSVYFLSTGSYSFYNTTKVNKIRETNSSDARFAFRHFVYLVNILAITPQKDSSKFATIAVHFVDNSYFSCSLFHLRNSA